MINGKLLFLASFLAPAVLGADVYARFYDSGNQMIGSTAFDVGNDGCFSLSPGPYFIQFSQSGGGFAGPATGPYCLNAWADAGCPGDANGQQQYANVETAGNAYSGGDNSINDGVNNAGSYSWTLGACDGS